MVTDSVRAKKNKILIKKPASTEEPLTLVESNACY